MLKILFQQFVTNTSIVTCYSPNSHIYHIVPHSIPHRIKLLTLIDNVCPNAMQLFTMCQHRQEKWTLKNWTIWF